MVSKPSMARAVLCSGCGAGERRGGACAQRGRVRRGWCWRRRWVVWAGSGEAGDGGGGATLGRMAGRRRWIGSAGMDGMIGTRSVSRHAVAETRAATHTARLGARRTKSQSQGNSEAVRRALDALRDAITCSPAKTLHYNKRSAKEGLSMTVGLRLRASRGTAISLCDLQDGAHLVFNCSIITTFMHTEPSRPREPSTRAATGRLLERTSGTGICKPATWPTATHIVSFILRSGASPICFINKSSSADSGSLI